MQNLYPLFERNRILKKGIAMVTPGLFLCTPPTGISGI